jgi:hypothetical protein
MPMRRPWSSTCFLLILVIGASSAQQAPPADTGDKTTPLLLKLVRERLASSTDLRPDDGVRIESLKLARGVLSLSGTVRTADQREKVRAHIQQGRRDIEDVADVKIQSIDVSGLQVTPGGTSTTVVPGKTIVLPGTGVPVMPGSFILGPAPATWWDDDDSPPPPECRRRKLFHRLFHRD